MARKRKGRGLSTGKKIAATLGALTGAAALAYGGHKYMHTRQLRAGRREALGSNIIGYDPKYRQMRPIFEGGRFRRRRGRGLLTNLFGTFI